MKQKQIFTQSGVERTALVAGCAGAVSLLSTVASGAIIVDDAAGGTAVVDSNVVPNVSAGIVGIEMNSNPVGTSAFPNGTDIQLADLGGGVFSVYAVNTNWALGVWRTGTDWYLQRFTSAAAIASHTDWVTYGSGGFASLLGSDWGAGNGYIGLRIEVAPGNYEYGWVNITLATGLGSMSVNSWNPDSIPGTTDKPLPAGTGTPEPAASGLALLALGAAGVLRQRRRHSAEEPAA